jgi:hypothetical protein
MQRSAIRSLRRGLPRPPARYVPRIPHTEWGNQAQWAVTCALLLAHLQGGAPWALPAAAALCTASLVWYGARLRSLRSYRMQIRIGVLAWLALSQAPGLAWILWVPVLGMAAQVLVGYCPMARLLDLLYWNRAEPFSAQLVCRTFTRAPGSEGLFRLGARTGRLDEARPC